jgi:hypothetical protein
MGHQTTTDFLVIQGKKGELLAAAVMLSIYGIEVSVPRSLVPGEHKAPKDAPNGTKKI